MAVPDILNQALLSEYIARFYGYGNYQGKYWFIGMEEGGGGTLEDIEQRLTVWKQRGKRELEDVAEYHLALSDYDRLFTVPTKAQPTWNRLIRFVLSSRLPSISLEQVKAYQREALGRSDSETCLLELLPLPSPSTGTWLYAAAEGIPGLQSREVYREHYAAERAKHIRQRIGEHRPPTVVFYSINRWYLQWWHAIAEVDFEVEQIDGVAYHHGADAHTQYLITHHPASHGIKHGYYHQLGRWIAASVSGS